MINCNENDMSQEIDQDMVTNILNIKCVSAWWLCAISNT